MSRPAPVSGALGPLLAELIDDAGLFPPASLTMADALRTHRRARKGDFAWMLGRFVCTGPRLWEVPSDLRVCLIVEGAEELAGLAVEIARRDGLVETVEARPVGDGVAGEPVTALAAVARDLGICDVFLEVAPETTPVEGLAGTGVGAKLRCGGLTPTAAPSCSALSKAFVAARRADVRVKATAGLHHPFRHIDAATGAPVHGFVNVLAAVIAADAGAVEAEVAAVVAEQDASAFALGPDGVGWRAYLADIDDVRRIRTERFAGFGSCTFQVPVDDLVSLGVLTPGTVLV